MENKRGLILTVVFFFCFIPLFSQQAPTSGKEVKQVENDKKKYPPYHSLHYPLTLAENSICFIAREMQYLREKYDFEGGKRQKARVTDLM